MSKLFAPLFAAVVTLGLTTTARADSPAIYDVLLDATGSVSQEDFRDACDAVSLFAGQLHERSLRRPGQLADWLAINLFGGEDDISGTVFVNCGDEESVNELRAWLAIVEHPEHGETAIHNAIVFGANELLEHDLTLPGYFVKTVIVVTDGDDNGSSEDAVNAVQAYFPDDELNLFVVGVGECADTSEFEGVADLTLQLGEFCELGEALVILSDLD